MKKIKTIFKINYKIIIWLRLKINEILKLIKIEILNR